MWRRIVCQSPGTQPALPPLRRDESPTQGSLFGWWRQQPELLEETSRVRSLLLAEVFITKPIRSYPRFHGPVIPIAPPSGPSPGSSVWIGPLGGSRRSIAFAASSISLSSLWLRDVRNFWAVAYRLNLSKALTLEKVHNHLTRNCFSPLGGSWALTTLKLEIQAE